MQAPNWTDFLQCCICTSKFNETDIVPISLSCGHTLCMRCLGKLKTRTCPYDKVAVRPDMEDFPGNAALLQLLGYAWKFTLDNPKVAKMSDSDRTHYTCAVSAIVELASFLQPLAEHGITAAITYLNKPMLKKLVTVVNSQVLEPEGQTRAVRAARSIADRAVTELLVMHQNQQQISTLLWTAVRNRGCQFLGPVMQEEALRLILKVLESGNSLSRKNIVLFVVQRLSNDFPQASKTSVGHVVQLLYRASCFNVEKRDDDSSLMQLKEEFRSYESLRREHDGQIIRMAMEAGLRISPEQWSTLLYGDHKHKSDMQSIIDKLISQGAASSGLSELIVAIGRSQDPYQLSEKVIPHLEVIFKVPITAEKSLEKMEWETFATIMEALLATLHGFTTFMQIQNGRFKTGMCPHLSKPGGCPKGERCTYAHSEEEREKFRNMVKPSKPVKQRSGDQFRNSAGRSNRSGDLGPIKAHTDTHVTLNSFDLLSSGPSSAPEHFSELLHYSGEQLQGLRQHASITAPVLSTRGEWQVRRGMPSIDHTYQNSENGLASYVSADHVYPATLGTASDPVPQYPPQLSNLDLLRQRHEAVKQSVEGSLYTRDLSAPPSAPGYVVTPGTIPPPSAASYYPQQREWMPRDEHLSLPPAKPTSNPYSLHSEETLSSGSLNQDSLPDQQFLTTEMEHLAVTSGYSSVIYPSGQKADSLSSSTSSVSSNPSLSSTSSTTGTATTASTSTGNAAGTVPTTAATAVEAGKESQDELKAEIERLRKQLREKDEKIQQQSVQLHYTAGVGGTSAVGGRVSAVPRSVMQQPAPASIQYSSAHYGNGGVVVADDLSRATPQGVPNQVQPTYSGLAQTTPSFGGTLPYNKQQLQAAAALAASIVQGSQSTAGYYPSHPQASVPAAPATHTPHQWSGPQAGVSPYQTAHTLVQLQPSAAARQPSFLEHSDEMLAAYLQMMEQSKATRSTAPSYQTTPAYNPQPQGQYYYHH